MNTCKYLVFIAFVIFIISTGCKAPQTPSEKQSRLIAAENMELQKQIEQLKTQIEVLKAQQEKELEEQKQLLTKANEEIEAWKEKSQQNVREQVQGVLDTLIQQNSDLSTEIEKLKSELENQRKQVSALEKMLTEKPGQ